MLFWSSTDYLLLHTVYVADTELRWISLTTFPNRRTTWLLIPSDCPQVGYHLFRCHTRNNYNRHDCCVTAREIAEVWGRPRLRRSGCDTITGSQGKVTATFLFLSSRLTTFIAARARACGHWPVRSGSSHRSRGKSHPLAPNPFAALPALQPLPTRFSFRSSVII